MRFLYLILGATSILSATSASPQTSCVDSLVPTSRASELISCLREVEQQTSVYARRVRDLEDRIAAAEQTIVPTNSVLIVDDPRGCPGGWSEFSRAYGRSIIGATGPNASKPLGTVTLRKFGEFGGEERVTLSDAELPRHQHLVPILEERSSLSGNSYPVFSNYQSHPAANQPNTTTPSTASGGGQSHNNMPPYIALYFCKKD